jgi:hypothetical protein
MCTPRNHPDRVDDIDFTIGELSSQSKKRGRPRRRAKGRSAAKMDEFAELAMQRAILAPKDSVKIKAKMEEIELNYRKRPRRPRFNDSQRFVFVLELTHEALCRPYKIP